ncbi:universal stress protein [Pseudonocardia oceani]|uniref:Universal stress protein n=4 Tax=Pseudonocardia oceani TaxID=2792013 RepID=A0ABS6UHM4_9PSEU|nr:universal stress protein [Pseudonocardia oceani]MBW0122070.1 universal stress protein [Pseudonocardia oceani]MBW0131742.1 universal stress protein [Pseudonocardia oceani]
MSAPVVVALDATPDAAEPAVRRAAREAAHRRASLQVLVPAGGDPDGRRTALVRALATARRAAPGVEVTTQLSDEQPGRALRMAAAEAALLVVAAASEHVDDLVVSAHCPLLVVPPTDDGDPAGPVLLGVGPATQSEVVAFAFAQAQDQGADLIAVRTWHDPLVDLGLLTGDRIARWDAADATVRHELADQLALAVLAHPDVHVTTRVVDDGCTPLLAALATRARLLVVGRPARGAALGRLRPSPALTLARHAPCPVVVVPPEGPTGRTLLPRRRLGRSDLRV